MTDDDPRHVLSRYLQEETEHRQAIQDLHTPEGEAWLAGFLGNMRKTIGVTAPVDLDLTA